MFPEELATHFYANDQVVLQTGQAILDYEEVIGEVDGRRRWILTSKLRCGHHGRIIGWLDWTRHHRAQTAERRNPTLKRRTRTARRRAHGATGSRNKELEAFSTRSRTTCGRRCGL